MSDDRSPMLGGHHGLTGREPALSGDRALLHLVELLGAPDAQTRLDAAFALAAHGDSRAAGHLLAILRGDQPTEVRRRAALALGPVGPAALPDLLALLPDPEIDIALVRLALGAAAGQFPETAAQIAPALIALVESGDHALIARGLAVMGSVRDETLLPWLVEAARGWPAFQQVAVASLGDLGGFARRPEVIDVLFEILAGYGDDQLHLAEADALARIGDPTTIPRALALLAEPQTRIAAALPHLVGEGMGEAAAPHLIAALADPAYRRCRAEIIRALGQTDSDRAVDCLLGLLGAPDSLTESIVDALRLLRRRRAIGPIVALLKSSYKPSVISECLHALSVFDDPAVAPDIMPYLAEPRVGGVIVVEMLTRFRYEPAVPALTGALAEPMLRTLAIRALLTIGTEAAYQGLAAKCDARTLRNARPWVSRDLWLAFYRWQRALRAQRR